MSLLALWANSKRSKVSKKNPESVKSHIGIRRSVYLFFEFAHLNLNGIDVVQVNV